jgi:hypothetical protein
MIHGKAPFSKDRLRASLTLLFSAQSNLHFRLAKPMFLLFDVCINEVIVIRVMAWA